MSDSNILEKRDLRGRRSAIWPLIKKRWEVVKVDWDSQAFEALRQEGLPAKSVKWVLQIRHDLYWITAFSLLLAGGVIFGKEAWPQNLRVFLGLPFVLFFPGYALMIVLFPGKKDLEGIERTAWSLGLSIALIPLLGLILNYTWGIRLLPILFSILIFIILISGLAVYRRNKIPQEKRFFPCLTWKPPALPEMPAFDKVLSIVLVFAFLFAAGSICYVFAVPKEADRFTEFYLLDKNGGTEDYPCELAVGEQGKVIIGIANGEQQEMHYSLQVKLGNEVSSEVGRINLKHGQTWEKTVTFSADRAHKNIKVEFLLLREGESEPYRTLRLWVEVMGEEPINEETA